MNEKGSFGWAVEQMKQGKKVKRLYGLYLGELNKELRLFDESGNTPLSLCDIEANDWEVVEKPKKTLWDKLKSQSNKNIPMTEHFKQRYLNKDKKELIKLIREEHDIGMGRATYFFKESLNIQRAKAEDMMDDLADKNGKLDYLDVLEILEQSTKYSMGEKLLK